MVVPSYLPTTYTLRDTQKNSALPPTGRYSQIHPDSHLLTNTFSLSLWEYLFCTCFLKRVGQELSENAPLHPLQRAFRALEVGGLSGSLHALGFPDPLIPDCSPWGDWGRLQDIVRGWLGSSKFQEAHPGLVQATKHLGMNKGLGWAGWIWFTM